ncbi:hypothetical protein F5883DRAFT_543620 [Diaporthe sp. PMI_573]|nr:hypothetical protein F5883DRAFT_543620 [Diaporthaceae sp. PMI_573]
MSENDSLLEEVLQKHGMTRERYLEVKAERDWQTHQRDLFVQGNGLLSGLAKTRDEFVAEKIAKAVEERRAKKAEEEKIEGWLRVLHQEKGQDFFLKVMVDTGATVNAITYGMLIDHQLESRITKLEEPLELDLAVGSFTCDEQISIPWMGKGNVKHDESTFYVLPRGRANITHRVILSKEWLKQRDLLCDEDERDGLKPLIGGRQSASEKAAREQARQQAMTDKASSSKAKEAYQKSEGQKEQGSSSTGPPRPKEAGK